MFQEYLYIAPVHVQLEAANSFSRVIQDEFVPPYMFASSFLPIVLHNIENRDTGNVVSNSLPSVFFLKEEHIRCFNLCVSWTFQL